MHIANHLDIIIKYRRGGLCKRNTVNNIILITIDMVYPVFFLCSSIFRNQFLCQISDTCQNLYKIVIGQMLYKLISWKLDLNRCFAKRMVIKLDPSQYKRINLSRRSIRDWRDLIGNGSIMSATLEEESDIRPCQIFGCWKISDLIYETRYQASYIYI